jgi:membrane associated rhomboid family serine protease
MSIQITQILTIAIFIISVWAFNRKDIFNKFLYSPYLVWRNKEWYRLLSAAFLHANWVHLLINLFVLWEFGSFLEQAYQPVFGSGGSKVFLAFLFLGGVIVANLPALYKRKNDMYFRSIGASGGVSAVLFSYILINPWSKLYLYFVLPLYSIVVGILFLVYSWWASKNKQDHIDHQAHFWGSIFGIIFTILVYPESLTIFWNQIISLF